MSKENLNYMPNENANKLGERSLSKTEQFENAVESSSDPLRLVPQVVRICEPSEKIYRRDSEIKNDPIKAISEVKNPGIDVLLIRNPITGLILGAARIDTAVSELDLNAKQLDVYKGFKENIMGAIGWFEENKQKVGRVTAATTLIGQMVFGATGCNALTNPEVVSTPIVETVQVETLEETQAPIYTPFTTSDLVTNPSGTSVANNEDGSFHQGNQVEIGNTPTSEATEIAAIGSASYPDTSTNFVKEGILTGSDAEKRIDELGAGDQLKELRDFYINELVRAGKHVSDYDIEANIFELDGKAFWNCTVKDSTGRYLKMNITEGIEKGQLVRAFGLVAYTVNHSKDEDFFDFESFKNPVGDENAEQRIIGDASGWTVIGLFEEGEFVGWFNADEGPSGIWVIERSADVNTTPEPVIVASETGTVMLDPEYNLGGLVEVNEDNEEANYLKWATAIYGTNRVYFEEKLGITSFDKALEYMKANILPAGLQVPLVSIARDGYYRFSALKAVEEPVDARNLYIRLVDYEKTISYEGYNIKDLSRLYSDNLSFYEALSAGVSLIRNNESGALELSLVIVQNTESQGAALGFPDSDGNLTQEKMERLDDYVRLMMYSWMSMDYSNPTESYQVDVHYTNGDNGFGIVEADKTAKIYTGLLYWVVYDYIQKSDERPSDYPKPLFQLTHK